MTANKSLYKSLMLSILILLSINIPAQGRQTDNVQNRKAETVSDTINTKPSSQTKIYGGIGSDFAKTRFGTSPVLYLSGFDTEFGTKKYSAYLSLNSGNIPSFENPDFMHWFDRFNIYNRRTNGRAGINFKFGNNYLSVRYDFSDYFSKEHQNSDYIHLHTSGNISGLGDYALSENGRNHKIIAELGLNKTKAGDFKFVTTGIFRNGNKNWLDTEIVSDNRETKRTSSANSLRTDDAGIIENIGWVWNRHRFIKPSVNATLVFQKNRNLEHNLDTSLNSFYNRDLHKNGSVRIFNANIRGNVDFILRKKDKKETILSAGLLGGYTNILKLQDAYNDMLAGNKTDTVNTINFLWQVKNAGIFSNIRHKTQNNDYQAGIEFTFTRQSVNSIFPTQIIKDYDYIFASPFVKISLAKKLNMEYRLSQILPTVEQLRPKITDVSPLFLSGGDPRLKRSIVHNFNIEYNTSFSEGDKFSARLRHSRTYNGIVTKIIYFTNNQTLPLYDKYRAKAGTFLTTFANAPREYETEANLHYEKKFGKFIGISADLGGISKQVPMYQENNLLLLKETNPYGTASLRARARNIDINASIKASYNVNKADDGDFLYSMLNINPSVKATYSFLERYSISALYSYNLYGMADEGVFRNIRSELVRNNIPRKISYNILNLSFGVKLLRNKNLDLRISGYDLLDSAMFTKFDNGVNFLRTSGFRTYQRSIIISFIYNI